MHRTTSGERLCKAGEVFVIPPGAWHAYTQCNRLELYNCQISPELLAGPFAWVCLDPLMGPLISPDPWRGSFHVMEWALAEEAIPDMRKLAATLFRTYETDGIHRRGKIVAELLSLVEYIACKGLSRHAVNPAPIHSAVQRAAEMLRSNLAFPWTLPELAAQLHIDPSYLVRLFRHATGCSPMKFLARERAQLAAQLLLASKLNIGEIGASVGWPEPKHFARCFHRHFGENATTFRERLKQEALP